MKIVLIGIQGAGKSTQGNLLSRQFHIPYLSTGHIFREIAKEKTQLGQYVKVVLTSGALIPDDETIKIVNSYLTRPEYQRGYIIDGFPRTLEQAKKFKNNVDKVIHIEIPDKEALWRLAYRNEQRDDDTIEAIRKRIKLFHTHTRPVINYYQKQGKVAIIDGTQSIDEVNQEILKNLGKQLIENKIHEWEHKNKTIVALVGMPGSGKTEAMKFFKGKKLPIVSFSDVINDYIDSHTLTHTEDVHNRLRKEFREEHGQEAMARLNKDKIVAAFKKNNIIVIEGMRSWEEYMYLKKELPKVQIFIVALYADKRIRYQRAAKRKYRSHLFGEERDINELMSTNMGPTIAFADILIKNNFSHEELDDKLEDAYRVIYFS